MAQLLKVSTAFTFRMGPFVDSTDGFTPETGLTLSQADYRLSKAGGAFAQKGETTSGAHDENGWYTAILNTTDTNTVGTLDIAVYESGALPVFKHFMVVPANIYDSLVAGSDKIDVNVEEWNATAVPAEHTAGYPIATIKDGTGTGEIDTTSGGVLVAALAANAITATAIAADAITAAKIADGAIDAATFAAGAINAAAIAADAITAAKVADGTIDAATFAAGAINAAAIAADAITDAKVASDVTIASVTGAVGSVTGAVGSVTGAVGSVTGAVGSIATGGIASTSFAAGAITATSIASSALGAVELAADATTEIADAVWATTTRVLTAGTNIALAKGTGVTGFNDLSAAQVNAEADTAIADAALATAAALATVDTVVDTILVDTAELQTDWADGGRLDLILDAAGSAGDPWVTALPGAYGAGTAGKIIGDNINATVGSRASQTSVDDVPTNAELATALGTSDDAVLAQVALVKSQTDLIPASPAAVGSAMTLTSGERTSVADALLNRDLATGTDSGSTTVRTARQALRFLRNKWAVSAGTLTVYKEDDSTASWTSAMGTDAAADPVVSSDPAGP